MYSMVKRLKNEWARLVLPNACVDVVVVVVETWRLGPLEKGFPTKR